MQEDGQNGKIILDPTTIKERHEEPDYYTMAEKIVKQRHWDQKPFLNKLGLPEPDELVRDEKLVKEEEERAQREKREEIERKLREQQRKIEEEQQQYYEQELIKQLHREQQFLPPAPTRPASNFVLTIALLQWNVLISFAHKLVNKFLNSSRPERFLKLTKSAQPAKHPANLQSVKVF